MYDNRGNYNVGIGQDTSVPAPPWTAKRVAGDWLFFTTVLGALVGGVYLVDKTLSKHISKKTGGRYF